MRSVKKRTPEVLCPVFGTQFDLQGTVQNGMAFLSVYKL